MQDKGYICVWAPDGSPLMPTKRHRHVEKLLNTGKARIACHVPFTIQLLYETPEIRQPMFAGLDPARSNIGIAVRSDSGTLVFAAVCETRNREIAKLMESRHRHRRASRNGERKARQRLAKRFRTMFAAGRRMRRLPKFEDGKFITCNYITNTEARYCNRKREENWVTPTVRHLVQTHLNLVSLVGKYLPVTDVEMEVNRFSFALLENPNLKGLDFQNGPLKGYDNKEEAVYIQQEGRCLLCGEPVIDRYHHLVPLSEGGSDTLENLSGLCLACHAKVHTDPGAKKALAEKKKGLMKKYGALSALNQAIPFIAEGLAAMFPVGQVDFVRGWETKAYRELLGFAPKDRETNPLHAEDAYCISLVPWGLAPQEKPDFEGNTYHIRQFRRHDRAVIYSQKERSYYIGKEKVAVNRRPRFEQKKDALSTWHEKQVSQYGREAADTMRSRLKVKKSSRSYNNLGRMMPGTLFYYRGQLYVMEGQQNNGTRVIGSGMKTSVNVKQCRFIRKNTGLVFCP